MNFIWSLFTNFNFYVIKWEKILFKHQIKTAIRATVKLGNNVFFSLELNLLLTLRGYNVFHQEPVPLSWNVTIDFESEKLQLKLYFSKSSLLAEQ